MAALKKQDAEADFLLAGFHVVQDRTEIEQYGDKAHESHIPVMLHQRPSDCLHKIAAQEEIRQ